MEYYCESLEMNSGGRIIEVVLGTQVPVPTMTDGR